MKSSKLWTEMLLLSLLLFAHAGAAQNKDVSSDKAATPASSTPTRAEAPSGPQEGIKVHGHWTITVRNSDGSIASRDEFENSVTDAGKDLLLNQLMGVQTLKGTVSEWAALIGKQQLCQSGTSTETAFCILDLQPQYDKPGKKLVLSGTFRVFAAGQISSVSTFVTNAVPLRKPGLEFSARDLTQPDSQSAQAPPAINVQAGQNVDVSVSISIS